jgi:predicted amidohydrolase
MPLYHGGRVEGVYRKIHPAMRHSVYAPGWGTPIFHAGQLIFGIVICNDPNYPDLAGRMAASGAAALFIPTNNGLPNGRASLQLNAAARTAEIARAIENRVWVIRADVAGRNGTLTSLGCSEIVNPQGDVVQEGRLENSDLLVADIDFDEREK